MLKWITLEVYARAQLFSVFFSSFFFFQVFVYRALSALALSYFSNCVFYLSPAPSLYFSHRLLLSLRHSKLISSLRPLLYFYPKMHFCQTFVWLSFILFRALANTTRSDRSSLATLSELASPCILLYPFILLYCFSWHLLLPNIILCIHFFLYTWLL